MLLQGEKEERICMTEVLTFFHTLSLSLSLSPRETFRPDLVDRHMRNLDFMQAKSNHGTEGVSKVRGGERDLMIFREKDLRSPFTLS